MTGQFRLKHDHSGRTREYLPVTITVLLPAVPRHPTFRANFKDCDAELVYQVTPDSIEQIRNLDGSEIEQDEAFVCQHMGSLEPPTSAALPSARPAPNSVSSTKKQSGAPE
jgi:hypothetical protein